MVTKEFCVERLREFIESEFERIESENLGNDSTFTFTLYHALRGTTAVWGRSRKTVAKKGFKVMYNETLKDLVKGEINLSGYEFESMRRGNRQIYRVVKCNSLTHLN